MSDVLGRLAAVVHRPTGIATTDQQLASLGAALGRVAPHSDEATAVAEIERAGAGSELVARLIDEVTINETYFYRAPHELEAVPWRQLHADALARGNPVIRVWASACATGEEAYTLAMLATEALGTGPAVSILATDISQAVLERGRAATYSNRAVANLPPDLYERYFVAAAGRHTVRTCITSLVRFVEHNLVTGPVPAPGVGAFDVVVCRNVLIYFDPPTVQRVVSTLSAALRPEGHLVLGAADTLSGAAGNLARLTATPATRVRARARLPRPVTRRPPRPALPVAHAEDDTIERALRAADAGDLETTMMLTAELIAREPLNSDVYFVRGLAEFGSGLAEAAQSSFRRALYLDPSSGLAAFQLARVSDALGDDRLARRAYAQALSALAVQGDRHRAILGQVDLVDVADACRARLLSAPAA